MVNLTEILILNCIKPDQIDSFLLHKTRKKNIFFDPNLTSFDRFKMKEYESMIEVREAQEKQFTNDFYRLGTSKRVVNKSYGPYHRKGFKRIFDHVG